MTSQVCIDASLALKLVLPEADSDTARARWQEWSRDHVSLIAPSLWGYEVVSVVRNRTCRNLIPREREPEAVAILQGLPVQLLCPTGLYQRASDLARRFNRPNAYDSSYLALAEMEGCPLWTCDERLFNAVRAELSWVHWLGNYHPSP